MNKTIDKIKPKLTKEERALIRQKEAEEKQRLEDIRQKEMKEHLMKIIRFQIVSNPHRL